METAPCKRGRRPVVNSCRPVSVLAPPAESDGTVTGQSAGWFGKRKTPTALERVGVSSDVQWWRSRTVTARRGTMESANMWQTFRLARPRAALAVARLFHDERVGRPRSGPIRIAHIFGLQARAFSRVRRLIASRAATMRRQQASLMPASLASAAAWPAAYDPIRLDSGTFSTVVHF